jgi:hypothetical protein
MSKNVGKRLLSYNTCDESFMVAYTRLSIPKTVMYKYGIQSQVVAMYKSHLLPLSKLTLMNCDQTFPKIVGIPLVHSLFNDALSS